MSTIVQKLTQLEQDRNNLVDNLTTMGIKGLTGDETFTELVPKVLEISSSSSDYQEVEWIQSDGNQTIDTGIYPVDGISSEIAEYKISFDPLNSSVRNYEQYFAGNRDTSYYTPKIFCRSSEIVISPFIYGGSDTVIGTFGNGKIDLEVSVTNGIVVNNVQVATYSGGRWGPSSSNMSFYIFNSHSEPDLKSSMRLYSLKMYTNSLMVRDFVPCYKKSDGEIGLLDKVSGLFFKNIGTGIFTKGPDVN